MNQAVLQNLLYQKSLQDTYGSGLMGASLVGGCGSCSGSCGSGYSGG